jgi:hypothetical protein
MTDVAHEDALSHPLVVPEEPLEPLEPLEATIKYNQREDTVSIDIEKKEQSPLLGILAIIDTISFQVLYWSLKEIIPYFRE